MRWLPFCFALLLLLFLEGSCASLPPSHSQEPARMRGQAVAPPLHTPLPCASLDDLLKEKGLVILRPEMGLHFAKDLSPTFQVCVQSVMGGPPPCADLEQVREWITSLRKS